MNRTFLTVLSAVVAVLVLTACQVTITPWEPPAVDVAVTASSSPTDPVANVQLAAGQTRWIQVSVPSGLRGSDMRLVVEADDDVGFRQLDLVLYSSSGSAIASTSGIAYFMPGLSGIGQGDIGPGASAARLEVDRSVSVVGSCFGPCISRRADVSSVYVRITNDGTTNEVVPFYAYAEPWIDEGETANDARSGAVPVSSAGFYRGAIERLGDIDWVRFSDSGTVYFDERPGYDSNLVMTLHDVVGNQFDTIFPGESYVVFAGEYGRIASSSQSPRASTYGFYTVELD
jgi:hypothetical protein